MRPWPAPPAEGKILLDLVVLGEPVPKARARASRNGNFYTPQATEKAQNDLAWEIRRARGGWWEDAQSSFGVFVHFEVPDKGKKKLDIDNLLKLVMDAATGVIWKDDRQVVEVVATMERSEGPHTALTIYRLAPE